ncbi:unnamed protein product [Alopecurus aequalis]
MESEGSSTGPNGGAVACAVCGGTAAVYCPADAAALCASCDAAIHAANPLSSRHERVPLAAAIVATSGVYDLFAADDEGVSSWPGQGQGQGSPNSCSSSFSNCSGAETSLFHLLSDVDLLAAGAAAGSPSDGLAIHGATAAPLWLHPGLAADASAWSSPSESTVVAAAAADRQERVRRYREKRKNRKFQKTIRYASRKAYAEARPRIKGRFVKRSTASDDDGTSAAAEGAKFWLSFSDSVVFDAASYGVVPTF